MFPQNLLQTLKSKPLTKKNEQQQQRILIMNQIMNNITCTISHQETDYYLMIKKQINENFNYLFLTDFDRNFWLEKIDYQFLVSLKMQMKIQTSLVSFVGYLAEGFRRRVQIVQLEPHAKIKVLLNLTQGLTINTVIKLNVSIDQGAQPDEHLLLLKAFFRQYYSIKQLQSNHRHDKSEKHDKKINQQDNHKDHENKRTQSIFSQNNENFINRDLINPVRKRRKGIGMKFEDPPQIQQIRPITMQKETRRSYRRVSENKSRSRSKIREHYKRQKRSSSSSGYSSSSSFYSSSS